MTNTRNNMILLTLIAVSIVSILTYQFISVDMRFFNYAMSIRIPKLLTILIAAFCIGTSSIVFQSVINNTIVTPCLLGMNALYLLIHTGLVFILGASSILVTNKNLVFLIDVALMGIFASLIYGYLFKKTKNNVLYVLLAGTVMATFFSSITNAIIRIMDPNEYTALQDRLIAGFNNANSEILGIAIVLIIITGFVFKKEIENLNVITLGKNQAINLGIDYDRTISKLLLGVTLFISIATALVGPISFLGLIVANISRQLFKTYKHTYLMMGSALVGIIILLLGQIVIEHILNYSTTISVFINIIGGVYFLYLILKDKNKTA